MGLNSPNKEQVFPRLPGADAAGGPTIQANMVDQRIPIKQTLLYLQDNPVGYTLLVPKRQAGFT